MENPINEETAQASEALRSALAAAAANPSNAEHWELAGLMQLELEHATDARASFERFRALMPTAYAHLLLGRALLAENRIDDAVRELSRARELDAGAAEVASALGVAMMRAGDPASARPFLKQAADFDPANEEAHVALARISVAEGDFDTAIALCTHVLRNDPVEPLSPLFIMGDSFLAVGAVVEAEQAYKAAVDVAPDDATSLAGLAQVHLFLGDESRAENELNHALTLDPSSPHAHVGLGNLFLGREAFDVAATHYADAITADPTFVAAYAPLAALQLLQGDLNAARDSANGGIALSPTDPGCLLVRAQIGELDGDFGNAEVYAARAVGANPLDFRAHLTLARSRIALEREPDLVIPHLEQAVALVPPENLAARDIKKIRDTYVSGVS